MFTAVYVPYEFQYLSTNPLIQLFSVALKNVILKAVDIFLANSKTSKRHLINTQYVKHKGKLG